MKRIYLTPTVELEELVVEQGIATSLLFGIENASDLYGEDELIF